MGQVVLDRRSLNRATLARQSLLERSNETPIALVERMLGLQAQTPHTWYTALWSRLENFDAAAFGRLLESKDVVRIATMRGTIHLLSAGDARTLRPLMQPAIERAASSAYRKRWNGLDLAEVAAAARAILERQPVTFAELGAQLVTRWPEHDPAALAQVARNFLALVQVPPRGVWGASGAPKHTTIDLWLSGPTAQLPPIDDVVLRYIAGFGPASVADVQAWSGLTRLGEVLERLRPQFQSFRSESGRELFDLPDAPRPHGDTPAPVRFLPDFDNLLLGFADRTRTGDQKLFATAATKNGALPGWILVDGFALATWNLVRGKDAATLNIGSLERLSAPDRSAITAEGRRLLEFLAPESDPDRVEFR
jgi:hypothetical protein